jgi:hypothetical protein
MVQISNNFKAGASKGRCHWIKVKMTLTIAWGDGHHHFTIWQTKTGHGWH